MRKALMIVAVSFVVCSAAFAGAPSANQFLISTGRGPGVGGDMWVTSVVIYNPDTTEIASVDVMFLERNADNSNPLTTTLLLNPGQQVVYPDFFAEVLGVDQGFGALHVVSNFPVVAGSRIFNNNVVTDDGVGTAGQWMNGVPYEVSRSYDNDLIGLKENNDYRTNIAVVEVTGRSCTFTFELYLDDALVDGRRIAILPYEAKQWNIDSLFSSYFPTDADVRIHVLQNEVYVDNDLNGHVLVLGSVVDNITGDPTTVESTVQASLKPLEGIYVAQVLSNDLFNKGAVQFRVQEADDGNYIIIGLDWSYIVQCNDDPFSIWHRASPVTGITYEIPYELEGPDVSFVSFVIAVGTEPLTLEMRWRTNVLPDGTMVGFVEEYFSEASGETFGPCLGQRNRYTVLGSWVGPLPPDTKAVSIADANNEPIHQWNHDGSVEMVTFEAK
jgi:hypothetical protein